MKKIEEAIWLQELSLGGDDAYKILFDRHFFSLNSFAFKYVEEQETAKDIVQDVLYELWKKRLYFENIITLKSYLYSAVRNKSLDVLKHRKIQVKYAEEQTYKDHSEFFFNEILEEEVYVLLKEAINVLPDPTRSVYDLTLLGHSNIEIADQLNLTLDAVKSCKKRGKKILQEKLKNLTYLLIFLS